MIEERKLKRYCCGDFTEIENYAEAIADTTQKWHCHHRKEISEDGEFQYSMKDLKEKELYYDRPPEELIFLTESDHMKLHGKGRSVEHCEKISKAKKGKKSKPFTDEHRENISKSMKGKKRKPFTAEHCDNLSKSLKGTPKKPRTPEHRKNLSDSIKQYYEDPENRRMNSERQKGKKWSNGSLGMHWYNNGIENKLTYDCPEGFVKGRLKK